MKTITMTIDQYKRQMDWTKEKQVETAKTDREKAQERRKD